MMDPKTDQIAQQAARLIADKQADSIDIAIRNAKLLLGDVDTQTPSHNRVKQHIQGLAMQSLGRETYHQRIINVWDAAEETMTLLDRYDPIIVGNVLKGHIDATCTLHIRIYTRQQMSTIAATLVEYGYEEPTFETANTKLGRLDRIIFDTSDSIAIVITKCLPEQRTQTRDTNLFTGKKILSADINHLRKRISSERNTPGSSGLSHIII